MKNGKSMKYGAADFEHIMMSGPEKKANQHDVLTPEDFVIEKVAGIDIYNPTIDNIERFVRDYTQNQLYYLHKKLVINVNLIPNHLNSGNPELVEDATGVVSFNFEGCLIELPFIVYGGQLVPFDVIQIGNQRVPYSQEYMKKIVKGILEEKQSPKNKALDPYVGVDKTVNPSSSVGFLGNVMSIQDEHRNRGDAMHVYAEDMDCGIEKEAGGLFNPATAALKGAIPGAIIGTIPGAIVGVATEPKKGETQAKHVQKDIAKGALIGGAITGAGTGVIAHKTNKVLGETAGALNQMFEAAMKSAEDLVVDMLAKLAEMKPYDLTKLKATIEKVAEEQFIAEFEKFASDDTEVQKKMEKVMAKVAATNWKNANTLKNGTYIQMPEMKESPGGTPEITMTPALVIDSFLDFGYANPKGKIVLTADQRVKILKNGDTMLCLPMDHPTFKVPSIKFESVKQGDYIMAFNGNQAMFPAKVTYVRQRKHDGNVLCDSSECGPVGMGRSNVRDETLLGSIVQLEPIGLNNDQSFFNSSNDEPTLEWEDPNHISVDINLVSLNGGKFNKLDYGQFIDAKAKETGLTHEIVASFFHENSTCSCVRKRRGDQRDNLGVWTVDPNASVVLIKGTISDYLENSKNIEHFASPDLKAIEKMASASEYVEVRTKNKQQNTFDMKLVYTDRSKRFYSQQVKRFDNVEEYKIRGIMRACGFEQAQAAEAVAKAKKDGYARFDLPDNATPDNVSGSAPKGVAEDTFSRIKNVLFTPEIKNEMAVQVAGAILGDVGNGIASLIKGSSEETGAFAKTAYTLRKEKEEIRRDALEALYKKAQIAAACSSMFEKVAMEKKTNTFREVALASALASDFLTKVAEQIAYDDFLPVDKIAEEIIIGQPVFEKMAFDLTKLKVEEYQNKNFPLDPNHIQQTVLSLAAMVDTAHAVTKVACDHYDRLVKEASVAGALAGAGVGAGLGAGFTAIKGHNNGDHGAVLGKEIGLGAVGGAAGGAVGGGIASHMAAKNVGKVLDDEAVARIKNNAVKAEAQGAEFFDTPEAQAKIKAMQDKGHAAAQKLAPRKVITPEGVDDMVAKMTPEEQKAFWAAANKANK